MRFKRDLRDPNFSWKGYDFPHGFQIAQTPGKAGMIAARAQATEAAAWCSDQFGPEEDRWVRWSTKIRFRDQTDATAFCLRWC